jgi:hypothetical protein
MPVMKGCWRRGLADITGGSLGKVVSKKDQKNFRID